jgi:hypothetical protein
MRSAKSLASTAPPSGTVSVVQDHRALVMTPPRLGPASRVL